MRPFIPRFYPLFYKNDYTFEVIFSPNMELGSQRVVGERDWRQRRGIARREESTWGGVGICVRDVVGWLISIGFTETFTGRQWNQESILLFSNIQYTALTLFSFFFPFFNMREKKDTGLNSEGKKIEREVWASIYKSGYCPTSFFNSTPNDYLTNCTPMCGLWSGMRNAFSTIRIQACPSFFVHTFLTFIFHLFPLFPFSFDTRKYQV